MWPIFSAVFVSTFGVIVPCLLTLTVDFMKSSFRILIFGYSVFYYISFVSLVLCGIGVLFVN
jgi:hypothetical protein